MKSMKLKAEQEVLTSQPIEPEKPEYPYGLKITLEDEQLKALGIKALPGLEQMVKLSGKGVVCSISASDSEYGSHRCLSIQITDLEVSMVGKSDAQKLYGE